MPVVMPMVMPVRASMMPEAHMETKHGPRRKKDRGSHKDRGVPRVNYRRCRIINGGGLHVNRRLVHDRGCMMHDHRLRQIDDWSRSIIGSGMHGLGDDLRSNQTCKDFSGRRPFAITGGGVVTSSGEEGENRERQHCFLHDVPFSYDIQLWRIRPERVEFYSAGLYQ